MELTFPGVPVVFTICWVSPSHITNGE